MMKINIMENVESLSKVLLEPKHPSERYDVNGLIVESKETCSLTDRIIRITHKETNCRVTASKVECFNKYAFRKEIKSLLKHLQNAITENTIEKLDDKENK